MDCLFLMDGFFSPVFNERKIRRKQKRVIVHREVSPPRGAHAHPAPAPPAAPLVGQGETRVGVGENEQTRASRQDLASKIKQASRCDAFLTRPLSPPQVVKCPAS